MEEKSRMHEEIFTNNLDIPYCNQCKNCRYRLRTVVKGDLYPPYKHTKCDIYDNKPMEIVTNLADCKFFRKEPK